MRIIAHRGARAELPENTIGAIALALSLNPDGVEFDITVSEDDQPIVIHQETFVHRVDERCIQPATSDTSRFWSAQFKRDYLCTLDAGKWFDREFAGDPGALIPDLKQVLSLEWGKIEAWIEVKDGDFFTPGLNQREGLRTIEAAKPLIENFIERNNGRAKILSFSPAVLERARELLPDVPRVLNIWRKQIADLPKLLDRAKELEIEVIQLADDLLLAKKGVVNQVRSMGMQIYAYERSMASRPTEHPDQKRIDRWREIAKTGIDGYTTDYVRQLLALSGKLGRTST